MASEWKRASFLPTSSSGHASPRFFPRAVLAAARRKAARRIGVFAASSAPRSTAARSTRHLCGLAPGVTESDLLRAASLAVDCEQG